MESGVKLVTISCPGHHETLVERLWHFFKTGQSLDYEFSNFDGHPVLAHLLVVDAFMPIEKFNDKELLDGRCLDSLLEFMYRGTVSVPEEGVYELLKVARALGFQMLVDALESNWPTTVYQAAEPSHAIVVPELVTHAVQINEPSKKVNQNNTSTSKKVTTPATVEPADPKQATEPATAFMMRARLLRKKLDRIRLQRSQQQHSIDFNKRIQCKHCRFNSFCVNAFRVHMAKHDSSIVVDKCKLCGKKITIGPAALQLHDCVDRYRYSCPHCHFRTYDKPRYQLHLSNHDPASAMPVFKCPTCSKPFLRQSALDRHEAKEHASESEAPPTMYSCSMCSYETKMKATYMNHLFKTHELDMYGAPLRKDMKCKSCDFCCVRPSDLKKHVAIYHNTEKPFKCTLCPYAAVNRTYLYMHNLRQHLKKRNHQCDLCESRFFSKSQMEKHRRIHTGERPFVCEICGKAYSDKSTLSFHAKCHVYASSDRHICHICGHQARRHQYLKAHFMNVHKMDAVSAAALAKPNAKPGTKPDTNPGIKLASPSD